MNVAVMSWSPFMVTLQLPMPVQASLQPANVDPEAGEKVKVTVVPVAKLAEHELPQTMPEELLVTVPLPLPANVTDKV